MTSRFFGSNAFFFSFLSSSDIQGLSLSDGWGMGLYVSLLGGWAPNVAEKFWRMCVYGCIISFFPPSSLWWEGLQFMDFCKTSCFMLCMWLWRGNYPDDHQLCGSWHSKLSTCDSTEVISELSVHVHIYTLEKILNTEKHRIQYDTWGCYILRRWFSAGGDFVP